MSSTARVTGLAAALLLVAPAAGAQNHFVPSLFVTTATEEVAAEINDDGIDDVGLYIPNPHVHLTGFEQVRSSDSAEETVPDWIRTNVEWWSSSTGVSDDDLGDEAEPIPPWVSTNFVWYSDHQVGEAAVSRRRRPMSEAGYGVLSGQWIPRGRSGRSFLLIPDDASRQTLLARIANGAPVEELDLRGTPKILLKISRDGDALLHVRARASFSEGKGRIRYKARLSAADVELP